MKGAMGLDRRLTNRIAGFLPGRHDHDDLRGARRRAVRRAYKQFARCYPRWAQSLFDEYFVEHTASDALTSGLLRPRVLADAWTRQLRYRNEAQRRCHARQVLPVAEVFVKLVRAEMI